MSQVIKSTVGWADATGRGYQQHIFWCGANSCWLLVEVLGGDTNNVRFYYNSSLNFTDGTWQECSGSPYAMVSDSLVGLISNTGCHLSGASRKINGVDVIHLEIYIDNFGSADVVHIRGRLDSYAVSIQSETARGVGPLLISPPCGLGIELGGDNKPITAYDSGGGAIHIAKWTNADTGTSWTPGTFPAGTAVGTAASEVNGAAAFPLNISAGPASYYAIFEDDGAAEPTSLTLPKGSLTAGAQVDLGFTALAGTSVNNMGFVRGGPALDSATPQLHCVLRTGANTFQHRKTTAGTVTWVAGDSIPNQTCKDGGGLFMASDGTNVWLFIIDSDAPNTVRYIKHNGTSWDATWTALETTTKTRTNISGSPYVLNQVIAVVWTEANGGNFDIAGSSVTVPAPEQAGRSAKPSLDWGLSHNMQFGGSLLA